VKDHKLSHIEIEKALRRGAPGLCVSRVLTPEQPNVAVKDLEHLDDRGIAKVGSYVHWRHPDIQAITKEQRALSAEKSFLQAVFGKVAEEMADTSLRVPHGLAVE